jgi:hypothetical protein
MRTAIAARARSVCAVEAFESFVGLAMEDEVLVISSAVKFPRHAQWGGGDPSLFVR